MAQASDKSQTCARLKTTQMSAAPFSSGFPEALPNGTLLAEGHYTVIRVIGQGSFGITYRCQDNNLQRPVAIKEFFPPGCARTQNEVRSKRSAEFDVGKQAFMEEARTLVRFDHPNIVKVLAMFESNGTVYMVMENVIGQTLLSLIKANSLPLGMVVSCIQQVAQALQTLHEADIIHRDVKPGNIILGESHHAVLLDFGLAQPIEHPSRYGTRKLSPSLGLGSESYAPPEQYLPNAILGPQADIYALGATCYHALTGFCQLRRHRGRLANLFSPLI